LQVSISFTSRSCWVSRDLRVLHEALSQYQFLLILVDDGVEEYSKSICSGIQVPHYIMVLQGGESLKSFKVVQKISNAAVEKMNRKGAVLAIGGGALSDMAGFLSSILFRSLPCFLVPTTLLSMVDSAIGGKTAINLEAGKNLVGTFSLPAGVFIDPASLDTLSDEQWYSGMGEILKTAALDSEQFFREVLKFLQTSNRRGDLFPFIDQCIAFKKEIVEGDFEESGARKLLNLGHTVGHALEAHYKYRLPHGICVWMGMILESRIGANLGMVSTDFQLALESSSEFLPFPLYEGDALPLMPFMEKDKKNETGGIAFVFMKKPGVLAKANQFIIELSREVIVEKWGKDS